MKLYLAGPISGTHDFNERFERAREKLREAGYEVVCPVEGCTPEEQEKHPWHWWMRRSLKLLLECQGIALMAGWTRSAGAWREREIAQELKMPAFSVEEWLGKHPAEQLELLKGA